MANRFVERLAPFICSGARTACGAWQLQSEILAGEIEPTEGEVPLKEGSLTTIRVAVDSYLAEAKATKGEATWRA